MSQYLLVALDLVAVTILALGLYWRRYHRRELVVAFLGVNIGVLAVSAALANGSVGAGLGLGLFGVLSIIRLRSHEIAHHEIAYYFAALALGLLGGLPVSAPALSAAGMVLVIVVLAIADSSRLLTGYREQTIVLDRALTDTEQITRQVAELTGARVVSLEITRLDLVNDTTWITARLRDLAPDAGGRDGGHMPETDRHGLDTLPAVTGPAQAARSEGTHLAGAR